MPRDEELREQYEEAKANIRTATRLAQMGALDDDFATEHIPTPAAPLEERINHLEGVMNETRAALRVFEKTLGQLQEELNITKRRIFLSEP